MIYTGGIFGLFTSVNISVHICSQLFTSVHVCSHLFTSGQICYVLICSYLFTSVHICSHLFTSVHICSHNMFTFFHICSHLFTSVHVCSHRFTSVPICFHLFTSVHSSSHFEFPVPLGVPRCTQKEVKLLQYCIPARSIVFSNIQAVHLNESYWTNACEFDPERFIDEPEPDDCATGCAGLGPCSKTADENFIPWGEGQK